MGLEGIVSKRIDSPSVRATGDLDQAQMHQERQLPDRRVRREAGGKVRSGYTEQAGRGMRERLDPLILEQSPLSGPVRKPKATWVKPEVLAGVQ
jgi:hypothetical protein